MTRTEQTFTGTASDEIKRYAEAIKAKANEPFDSMDELYGYLDSIGKYAEAIIIHRAREVEDLKLLLQPAALEAA